jgi:cell wall-associated NlpC family hydrolase
MASVRARFGASLGLAVAATLLPVGWAPASATPAPAANVLAAPSAHTATVTSIAAAPSAVTLPKVGAKGTVVLPLAVRRSAALRGTVVIAVARRYRGIAYHAGGTTPRSGFDCSGYTKYVFAQVGIRLPRVSRDQYAWSKHISLAQAVPGDLVFFHSSSGRVYHAAIYAGHGYVWHSPHTGTRVRLERIWTSAFYVGRVRV